MLIEHSQMTQVWRYEGSSQGGSWNLMHTGAYGTTCLTQIFAAPDASDLSSSLITASTDGYIATWRRSAEPDAAQTNPSTRLKCLRKHRSHQNAIKGMQIIDCGLPREAPSLLLCVTVGDDNALGLTLIRRNNDVCATLLIPRAHAAAINALAVLPRSPKSDVISANDGRGSRIQRTRIVTCSNDQRVKMWEVSCNLDLAEPWATTESISSSEGIHSGAQALELKKLADEFIDVADVSCMAAGGGEDGTEEDTRVIVCGVGMDVWRVGRL